MSESTDYGTDSGSDRRPVAGGSFEAARNVRTALLWGFTHSVHELGKTSKRERL